MFKLKTMYPWDFCPLDLRLDGDNVMRKQEPGQGCGAGSRACTVHCEHFIKIVGTTQYCCKMTNEQRVKEREAKLCLK
jgi:hypothetical protein